MEIAEVQDRESLERYLDGLPEGERREVALRVACRAAARVLPIAVGDFFTILRSANFSQSAEPIFGVMLLASLEDAYSSSKSTLEHNVDKPKATALGYSSRKAAFSAIVSAYFAPLPRDEHEAQADDANDNAILSVAFSVAASGSEAEDIWDGVQFDLRNSDAQHIWEAAKKPYWFEKAWEGAKNELQGNSTADWSFWISWYERLIVGRDFLPDEIAPILRELDQEDWEKGPAHINPLFDDVLAQYRAQDLALSEALQAATPVEFTFASLLCVMRMVGIDDTTRHLRDPAVVQSFLDDASEVREGFEDFVDDAKDLQGGNFAGVLRKRAEKILSEFDRAQNDTHLRAERIVTLANDLEIFANDEKAATDLGVTLKKILDSRLEMLKRLCREHFGPAYTALAPLAELNFDQIEQSEVLRIFDNALVWLREIESGNQVPLDVEGIAVFHDMQSELYEYRAAIAEASTDDFRDILENRFAARSGAMGLAIGRFYQRSSEAAGRIDTSTDGVIKKYKKVQTLSDIADMVTAAIGGGGL